MALFHLPGMGTTHDVCSLLAMPTVVGPAGLYQGAAHPCTGADGGTAQVAIGVETRDVVLRIWLGYSASCSFVGCRGAAAADLDTTNSKALRS